VTAVAQVIAWSVAITTVAGAIVVLWKFAFWARARAKKWDTFMDDWNGTPARPGVAERPGVMARLDSQDAVQAEVRADLANVKRHVGNGNPIPLREVVDGNCQDIKDIRGIIGSRGVDAIRRDSLGNYVPTPKKKATVKA
jgi:hypothetical protein